MSLQLSNPAPELRSLTLPSMNEQLALYGGPPVRPKDDFLVFGAPLIEEPEIAEVVDCMRRRWLGTGPKVQQFEKDFAAFKGTRHSVALNSCTAALQLAMRAARIGPGDEVITTPMTFCATVNAIIHCGATPVLADCDSQTMNILPGEIAKKVTERTKAIVPVHFAGRCCDMDSILEIIRSFDLLLIEDCAHAIEAEYHGRKAGTFGDIGCFSFYATKNIVTGEGGMVVTQDDRLAERIKILGLHGMSKDAWMRFSDDGFKHYQVIHAGFKHNMMDIQAAMGIHQLKRVDAYWSRRKQIWDIYNQSFSDLPCFLPPAFEPDTKHACHLYILSIDIEKLGKSRDWVLNALAAENIGAGVHYVPVHLHPFYRKTYGWTRGDFPNAEWLGERVISLPISPALDDDDVRDIVTAVRKILGC